MEEQVGSTDRAHAVWIAGRWHALRRRIRKPGTLLRDLSQRIGADRLATLAAAQAYYAFFALFPFLLFLLSLVTLLPGVRGIEDWLLGWAARVVPGEAFSMLDTTIRSILAQPRGGLLSLGAVLALWSASAALVGLMDALNVAYGVRERRPWWRIRLEALGLTIGLSFFMILGFVLTVSSGPLAAWAAGYLGPLAGAALLLFNWLTGLAAITLVIAIIYHVCPDVDFAWRWFSPGSVLFTVGFAVITVAFSYYVGRFASYNKTYGSLGAVIILLLWMYLVSFLLLLGGELNAVLDVQPEEDGREPLPASIER